MYYDVAVRDRAEWPYYFGFVLASGSLHATFMLSISLVSKICAPELRGTMFSISGMFGSIGIAIFSGVGGYLYDNVSILGPYYFSFGTVLLLFVVTLALGLSGKMKI